MVKLTKSVTLNEFLLKYQREMNWEKNVENIEKPWASIKIVVNASQQFLKIKNMFGPFRSFHCWSKCESTRFDWNSTKPERKSKRIRMSRGTRLLPVLASNRMEGYCYHGR